MLGFIFFFILSIICNIALYLEPRAKNIRKLEEQIKELKVLNEALKAQSQENQAKYDKLITANLKPTNENKLITKCVDRRHLINSLKALNDAFIFISWLNKDMTLQDSKSSISMKCK